MASSEDAIRSAVPGGIGKPLMLALLALLASGVLFGRGSKEGPPLRVPKRHPRREPAGYTEDWAGWWTNFRKAAIPGLVLAKISRSRQISLVRPLAVTS